MLAGQAKIVPEQPSQYFSIVDPRNAVTSLLRTSVLDGLLVSIEAVGRSRTESSCCGEDQDA